ncbi:hypothetical protein B0H14DRAFT_2556844 [Mycena olivaceomarginata]|nr:hypothetical protein B0H14DRAFT_2556844 [Mycena olivaceomarginata]
MPGCFWFGKVVMRGSSRTWVKVGLMVGYKNWGPGRWRVIDTTTESSSVPAGINVEHRNERDGEGLRLDGNVGKVGAGGVPQLVLPIDDVDLLAGDSGTACACTSVHSDGTGAAGSKEKRGESTNWPGFWVKS